MTPQFIAAILDTLLPGDDVLPSATRAGLPLAAYAEPHSAVLDAIAAQAGGLESFTRSDEASRGNAAMVARAVIGVVVLRQRRRRSRADR